MANATEIAVKLAEENTLRKVLAMAKEAKDKSDILEKLEAQLEK